MRFTALSGSGPAYFYRLAQAMAEVAVEMGLGRQLSEELSRQTLIGAGCLLKSNRFDIEGTDWPNRLPSGHN